MLIANGTLILSVDGAKMLILRNDGGADNLVLTTLAHEEADNPPTRVQGAGIPGRTFSRLNGRRSAYGETDWHQQAEDRFALRTVEKLDEIVGSQAGDIVVIAPPRMLGELRRHYGRAVRERLITEIPKDMVGHKTDDIARLLAVRGD